MQLENFDLHVQFTIRNTVYSPSTGRRLKKRQLIPYTVDINAYTVILITTDRQNQFKI